MKSKRILLAILAAMLCLGLVACSAPAATTAPTGAPATSAGASQTAKPSQTSAAASQAPTTTGTAAAVRVGVINGPSGISLTQLVSEGASTYDFSFAPAPDTVVGYLTSGQVDIACLPANVAATVYNKTSGDVQLMAITGLGMLSILEKGDSVQTVADLKGKTIVTLGQGSTTEYALNYVLQQNGLEVGSDVTVEFKSEAAEVGSLFTAGNADIVMLPEPFATVMLNKNTDARVALDINQEFTAATKTAGTESPLLMTGVVVTRAFAEENPQAVATFLSDLQKSIAFVNSDAAAASQIIADKSIIQGVDAGIIAQAIPRCNITYMDGASMTDAMATYMDILYAANPKSIGGALPGEDFYYAS